jgi:diguanylate cyclase
MSLTIDASIGIALAPDHARDAEELLQLADMAMYAAKARRVGVLVYDDERDGQGRHRVEVAEALREGLAERQLVLHYQPKLDVRTETVAGVEALVRWQHPTRGLLYPDAFIDIAESFGMMAPLTVAVLDQALRQCRRWHDEGLPLTVAVNVSPSNLVDPAFPRQVGALLAAHGLPPGALVLEVTESLLMEDRDRAATVLTQLRAAGTAVAIDDYGTGYSSLAYLADLPVTEIKLDRTFVAAMTTSDRNAAIVTSTVRLAHALGLTFVAEGVEDEATLAALSAAGCDVAQGYHISRPLPADAVAALLRAPLAVAARR